MIAATGETFAKADGGQFNTPLALERRGSLADGDPRRQFGIRVVRPRRHVGGPRCAGLWQALAYGNIQNPDALWVGYSNDIDINATNAIYVRRRPAGP